MTRCVVSNVFVNNPIWHLKHWFLIKKVFLDDPFLLIIHFVLIIHGFLMTGIFWSSNLRAQHLRWLQLVHFPKPHEPENQGDPKSSNGVQDGWIIRWVPDPGSREMIHPRSWNGSPLKKLVLGVDYVDYFPDLGFDNLMKGLSPSKKLERRVTCKMWQADLAWLVAETWGTHEKNIWCLNTYIYLYKHVYIYIYIFVCVYTIYSYYIQ